MKGIRFKWQGREIELKPGERFILEPLESSRFKELLVVTTAEGEILSRQIVDARSHLNPESVYGVSTALAKITMQHAAASRAATKGWMDSVFPIICPGKRQRVFSAADWKKQQSGVTSVKLQTPVTLEDGDSFKITLKVTLT